MKFINQNDYPHVKYNHNVANGGVPEERRCVESSGCGLCAGIMMVDALTTMSLALEDCVKLSENSGANHGLGTDMNILGPVLAKIYNLNFKKTNSLKKAISHLRKGGHVIALVTVPKGQEVGLFTKKSHFINLVSTDGKDFCILDPSYEVDKYNIPERIGKVNENNLPFLYVDVNEVDYQAKKETYAYYLFSRKK